MKKAQVTIFIIVALVIVATVVLFLFFRGGVLPEITQRVESNPEVFLDSCLETVVKDSVTLIASQGGYVENELHKVLDGEKISYLCYTQNYYSPCINQEPVLLNHLKEEIKNHISGDVDNCFVDLRNNFEEQAYEVILNPGDFDVELAPKRVRLDIKREVTLTKSGETTKYDGFKINVPTRFYDLSVVVQEIVSQEAEFCNFEHGGFMLLYPEFDINRFRTSDLSTIYTVTHKKTNEAFRFAIRGCTIPPAF